MKGWCFDRDECHFPVHANLIIPKPSVRAMPFDHVVSINDFSNEEIMHVFEIAEKMLPAAKGKVTSDLLDGKILAGKVFFTAQAGQKLTIKTPGGGGWGVA